MTKAVETDFLVITAQPGSNTLTDTMLATLADAIPTLPAPERLGDDAVQYAIAPDMLGIADAMTDRLGDEAIDINRVSDAARQKKMLIADLESTIIEQECLDELAKTIGKEEVIIDITTLNINTINITIALYPCFCCFLICFCCYSCIRCCISIKITSN